MAALSSTRPYRRGAPPSLPDEGRYVASEFKKIEDALKGIQSPSAIDISGKMDKSANLSDVANVVTARSNLLLGSAATHAATDFLLAASNLSDVASAATARSNIGADNAGNLSTGTLPDARLANVITAGSVGDASHIPVLTYDAHGRITGVSTASLASGGFVTPQNYGAVANGSATVSGTGTDDKGKFDSAAAASQFVLVPAGVYRFAASATYSSSVTFWFLPGAVVAPDTGVTVTFQGPVLASPHYQIFGSNGVVQGITDVYAEWWGIDGTSDDVQINQAIYCAEHSSGSFVAVRRFRFLDKRYNIGKPIIFTPVSAAGWQILGAGMGGGTISGTRIVTQASFDTTNGDAAVIIKGSATGSSLPFPSWTLRDLEIFRYTNSGSPSTGLLIGSPDARNFILYGFSRNIVEKVGVFGFQFDCVIQNTRLYTFRSCKFAANAFDDTNVTGCVGTTLTSQYGTGAYGNDGSGDCSFVECEWDTNGTGKCVSIHSDPFSLGATLCSYMNIGGVVFDNCQFYFSAVHVEVYCIRGGRVDGLWLKEGCQFEGRSDGTGTAVSMTFSGTGVQGYHLHVNHNYMSGNGFDKHVVISSDSSADVRHVHITDNDFNTCDHEAVDLRGTGGTFDGVHVNGNNCSSDPGHSTGQVIYLENVTRAKIGFNNWPGPNARSYFINCNGGSANVHNNSAWGNATSAVQTGTGVTTQSDNTN
jgi:hypothetical protein